MGLRIYKRRGSVKVKRKTFSIVLMILALHILSSCAVFDGARMLDKDEEDDTSYVTPAPVVEGIGGTCDNPPWRITLVEKETTNSIGTAPLDTKAADNMTLLILYFDVTNISESDEYFNYMYFTAEVDGAKAELIVPAATTVNERKIALGTVPKDGSASYYVVYQVPESWSTFKIKYDTGGMTSNVLASFEFKA